MTYTTPTSNTLLIEIWKSGVAAMCEMNRPSRIPAPRWTRLMDDALLFLPRWAPVAARLGWTSLDLFGVGQDAPDERLDLMGLVPMADGRTVVAMDEGRAHLRCPDGTIQTFCRKPPQPGRVALWELP